MKTYKDLMKEGVFIDPKFPFKYKGFEYVGKKIGWKDASSFDFSDKIKPVDTKFVLLWNKNNNQANMSRAKDEIAEAKASIKFEMGVLKKAEKKIDELKVELKQEIARIKQIVKSKDR